MLRWKLVLWLLPWKISREWYTSWHYLSFRRPKGGRISVTYTKMFTWMFSRFFASLWMTMGVNRYIVTNIDYFLRFSQILENQCHLAGGEHALRWAVVRLFQGFHQVTIGLDPLSQAVQGRSGSDVGCIGLCQLAFEIGTDFHTDLWFLISDWWCMIRWCKDTNNQRGRQ